MAFDGTLKFDTAIDKSGFESGVGSLVGLAKKGMELCTAAVTATAGAMVALGKSALDAYADYEQLSGGIETLFSSTKKSYWELYDEMVAQGASLDEVNAKWHEYNQGVYDAMENAAVAFKTAGMSQNQYMETVTSFSAALIASLGGDTVKAAELADMAIIDMADNANKMGSSMESIQNAYQGFAKQNYTMLDNLKLGYGGTKEEMQRLLADAEAISGIHYDISSYADVVQAIHVIQTEMGITGTTAKEASETISGSLAAAKAAWENLLIGIADTENQFPEELLGDFVESAAVAAENIMERIDVIIGGMGTLASSFGDILGDAVTKIAEFLPDIVSMGKDVVLSLADGITENIDTISGCALEVAGAFITAYAQLLPKLYEIAAKALNSVAKGITDNLPQIKQTARQLIIDLTDSLTTNLPILIEAAAELVSALAELIADNTDVLLDGALQVLEVLASCLLDNIDVLVDAAVGLVLALAEYISDNSQELAETAISLVKEVVNVLIENAPELLAAALVLFGAVLEAVYTVFEEILTEIGDSISEIGETLGEGAMDAVQSVGEWFSELPSEIAQGLSDVLYDIGDWGSDLLIAGRDAAKELVGSISDKIGELPDKMVEIGKELVEGIWDGIKSAKDWLFDKISDFGDDIIDGVKGVFRINSPSRRMRDEVGEPIAEGIGVGMNENIPRIGRDAVRALEDISPEISVKAFPETDSSAISALRIHSAQADAVFAESAPVSEITNNVWNYSTEKPSPEDVRPIELHAQFVVGEEVVAEGIAVIASDNIDRQQGVTVKLKERSLA
ncbi:MAG: hypothetical protein PUB97_08380 [Ruminococcus sp.]|nr:hypothetical protein [Ruminococcus sp.]